MLFKNLALPLICCLGSVSLSHATQLEELIVTAELRETSVLSLPTSVSVIDAESLGRRHAINLEDALNLAPNVNFAQGASRGRFIQIRGIGERSEFVDPVSYSVGVLVDGIDVTGVVGSGASLDLQQIEVLRGPQGTLYGANALAGLINMVSAKPSEVFEASLSASYASYDTHTLRATVNLPVDETAGFRISAQQHRSDGYYKNIHLNRDDNNRIDENSVKLLFASNPNDRLGISATVIYDDVDNGYDAFSLDTNRNTYSDQPGFDRQTSIAAALQLDVLLSDSIKLEANMSHFDADIDYGYDEDWSHPGICDNTACDSNLWGFDWYYESFDDYQRNNSNSSVDLRLLSDNSSHFNWLVGVYAKQQDIDLVRIYTYDSDFNSRYETDNQALYGQIDLDLSNNLDLSVGLRFEQRSALYNDNRGVHFDLDEDLWGGKAALTYQLNDNASLYALAARGYKAGGLNSDGSLPSDRRIYDTEFQWNYEIGVKGQSLDGNLTAQVSVFYQDRTDIQSKQSIVASQATGIEGDPCPCSFTDYIDNAAEAASQGIEMEARYRASELLSVFASAGWLKAEFDQFLSTSHTNYDETTQTPYNLDGRQVAHAPKYQYHLGAIISFSQALSLQLDIEAKDGFYFSDRHDTQSDSFELLNAELRYQQASWQASLWGKNLTDKDYQTRGFGSFGNDPRKLYVTEPYYQYGAPRVIGASATVRF